MRFLTVSRLIRELQKIEREGRGSVRVAVNTDTLNTGNQTWNICGLKQIKLVHVGMLDGDGFRIKNKNGIERVRLHAVLQGELDSKEPA